MIGRAQIATNSEELVDIGVVVVDGQPLQYLTVGTAPRPALELATQRPPPQFFVDQEAMPSSW